MSTIDDKLRKYVINIFKNEINKKNNIDNLSNKMEKMSINNTNIEHLQNKLEQGIYQHSKDKIKYKQNYLKVLYNIFRLKQSHNNFEKIIKGELDPYDIVLTPREKLDPSKWILKEIEIE